MRRAPSLSLGPPRERPFGRGGTGWAVGRRVEWRDTPGAATRPKAVWSTEGDGRQRMTVTEGPSGVRHTNEEPKG